MIVKGLSLALSLLVLCSSLGNTTAHAAAGEEWLPVDPSHIAAAAPVVDKNADAEAIFWDVRVQDDLTTGSVRMILTHYIRIKIFTERGKEQHGQVELPFLGRTKISDIAGRTIKPDGTIVELKKDAVFERTLVKTGDVKVKAKTFAMPAVEPGCIVEYRWKETRNDAVAHFLHLDFQREIPVQRITYHLKPLPIPLGMRTITFNGDSSNFVKEGGGFYATTMTNVPAFKEEPRMPADEQVRAWMLVYYAEDQQPAPAAYWSKVGKDLYNSTKSDLKVDDDIKKAVATIVGDAKTDDEKLERLYDFCRIEIKNVSDDASGMSDDEIKKMKENKRPSDTLKRKMGTGLDVVLLFGALANAAGFDARLALMGDHRKMRFDPKFTNTHFLELLAIAVKVGNEWRFCDPSERYLPYGVLYWAGCGQNALVGDPKEPLFVETPVTTRDKSVERRSAKLELSEDGTLEGDVRVEFHGHSGRARKEYNDEDTPEERVKTLTEAIKSRISTAEVSNVKVLNVTDPKEPFIYEFHIRVPGYAQRTGKRLFVQPAFFQYNMPALFASAERKHRVNFEYAWTEQDEVTIELPAGFELDHADAPESFGMGQAGGYDVKIYSSKDGRTIQLKRSFSFGGPGLLQFSPSEYEKIKRVFDTLHERDKHALTLKQVAATN